MATTHGRQMARMASVLVMVAGRGWAAGVFSVGNPWWTSLILSIPIVLLVVLALTYFQSGEAPRPETSRHWAAVGMYVYAGLSLLLAALSLGVGLTGAAIPDIGARTLVEVIPTATIGCGALLWLATLIPGRRYRTQNVEHMAETPAARH